MSLIKILIDLGLLRWSTIHLGVRKGWVSKKEVADYAVDLLVNGNNEDGVALLAGGECLEDNELLDLVYSQSHKLNDLVDLDKWRLAHLIYIAESNEEEQTKIDRLQAVYADFGYPEDMASCSIYAQDEVDPLVAIMRVIKKLKRDLGSEKSFDQ